jgi:hypothetical protein
VTCWPRNGWKANAGAKPVHLLRKRRILLEWLVPRIVNEFKLRKIKDMHIELEHQIDALHKSNIMTRSMRFWPKFKT